MPTVFKKNFTLSLPDAWLKGFRSGNILFTALGTGIVTSFYDLWLPDLLIIMIGALVSLFLCFIYALVISFVSRVFRLTVPPAISTFIASLGVFFTFDFYLFQFPKGLLLLMGLFFLLFTGVLSGTFWQLIKRDKSSSPVLIRALTLLVVLIAICLIVVSNRVGTATEKNRYAEQALTSSYKEADNPSAMGPYKVMSTEYGSANNKRRMEYANAALKTQPVDATLLLPEWRGFKKKIREYYWGYGINELPVNGKVWYPEGKGPFPLIVIVHGSFRMERNSELGYAYLGNLLASRGYIVASIDENCLNVTWSGQFHGKEVQAKAWLVLEHLKVWRNWNDEKTSPFWHKVDMDNIALIGHSRGGESIAVAAGFNRLPCYPDNSLLKFDYYFNIRALVGLAPTDLRYTRGLRLTNVNYLMLHGCYDALVPNFLGTRQSERISFAKNGYWFKSALFLYSANHNQFNTVWGECDMFAPYSWMLNSRPVMKMEEQQQVAKVYVSAFMDASLKHKLTYLPLFQDWRQAGKWLPENAYISRFEDNKQITLANYEEDIDLSTASLNGAAISGKNLSVWRESELLYNDQNEKQGNSAVVIGWHKTSNEIPSYGISFPKIAGQENSGYLTLDISAGNEGELNIDRRAGGKNPKNLVTDFSIVLTDSSGNESSVVFHDFFKLQPAWKVRHYKFGMFSFSGPLVDTWETMLGTFRIPLSAFQKNNPLFNSGSTRRIEFRFDQTDSGLLILDRIGLAPALH